MRHYLLLFTFTLYFLNAQVGIGNESPRGLLDVNNTMNGTTSAGLVLPIVKDPSLITNPSNGSTDPVNGTIIYNEKDHCLSIYQNYDWHCLSPERASAYINCTKTNFSGYFESGVPLENQSASITFYIKNNSLVPIKNVDISDAVTAYFNGVPIPIDGSVNTSASLQPGEEKSFTYNFSGTIPSTESGFLLVTFEKFSLSCTLEHPIAKGHIEVKNLLYKGLPLVGSYLQASYDIITTGSITSKDSIIKWYTSSNSDGSEKKEIHTTETDPSLLFLSSKKLIDQYIIVEVIPVDNDGHLGTPKTYMHPTKIQAIYGALKPGASRSKLVSITNSPFAITSGYNSGNEIRTKCNNQFKTSLEGLAINGATPIINGLAIGNYSVLYKTGNAINGHLIPVYRAWYLDNFSSSQQWTGSYGLNDDKVRFHVQSHRSICTFDWN